ncbi:MAG: hypothetical protein CM15mP74_17550 [Halieaceae bacterium]|nr:MAG: hypothetical protein CM15mP74_17550 [Halieaceae bacterium]
MPVIALTTARAKPRLQIDLKYYDGKPVIAEIERISKPSSAPLFRQRRFAFCTRWIGSRHCVDLPRGDDRSGGTCRGCRRRSPLHRILIRERELLQTCLV